LLVFFLPPYSAFFFFQAEDGIRDATVTGVQTCALPISIPRPGEFGYNTWPANAWRTAGGANCWAGMTVDAQRGVVYVPLGSASRSEERRVGKEGRAGWRAER